jgi:SNF2 family DNA or RNA helicase
MVTKSWSFLRVRCFRRFLEQNEVLSLTVCFPEVVRALDLLEELLKLKRYRYERLDGSTSSSSRAHAVDRFNRKSMQRFVMLLSTRAGGLGLNLTAADIVIIFDSGALQAIRRP